MVIPMDKNVTTWISNPADTRRLFNAGFTLVQRRRRWTNVKPTLIKRLVSAGKVITSSTSRRQYVSTSRRQDVTTSRRHDISTSLRHYVTTSVHHISTLVHHDVKTSLRHYVTTSRCQDVTTSVRHYVTTSRLQYVTTSRLQYVTTSLRHLLNSKNDRGLIFQIVLSAYPICLLGLHFTVKCLLLDDALMAASNQTEVISEL